MKSTLIAVAIAGVIASGTAAAATVQSDRDTRFANFAAVQYTQNYEPRLNEPRYNDDRMARWDDRSVSINEREARINARIDRGFHDGRLTEREVRRLQRELAYVEAKERGFKSDGRLSRRETDELNRDLDRVAANLRTQLGDEQRRY